jgi:hypothetical protein
MKNTIFILDWIQIILTRLWVRFLKRVRSICLLHIFQTDSAPSQPLFFTYLRFFLRCYIALDVKWLLNIHTVSSLRLSGATSPLSKYAYRERNCSALTSSVHLWSKFQHSLLCTRGDQQNAQRSALDVHINTQLYNIQYTIYINTQLYNIQYTQLYNIQLQYNTQLYNIQYTHNYTI